MEDYKRDLVEKTVTAYADALADAYTSSHDGSSCSAIAFTFGETPGEVAECVSVTELFDDNSVEDAISEVGNSPLRFGFHPQRFMMFSNNCRRFGCLGFSLL